MGALFLCADEAAVRVIFPLLLYLPPADGAAMRAGVQTGDRIIKVSEVTGDTATTHPHAHTHTYTLAYIA